MTPLFIRTNKLVICIYIARIRSSNILILIVVGVDVDPRGSRMRSQSGEKGGRYLHCEITYLGIDIGRRGDGGWKTSGGAGKQYDGLFFGFSNYTPSTCLKHGPYDNHSRKIDRGDNWHRTAEARSLHSLPFVGCS